MSRIADFISSVEKTHKTGSATEHSYRSAIEALFNSLEDDISALNEPKRVKCGAPDFIIHKGDLVIGHVEAKDLHIGLRKMKDANKAQQERYKAALPNLLYTNCLDWDFYRDGELVASVTIADLLMGIQPRTEEFEKLEHLLKDYISQRPQTITSPKELAERMAGKANLIKDVLGKTLVDDQEHETDLFAQYEAFKENLIHDITIEDFADIYAETIAYGMFAARLHDTTLDTFDRQEALELLPKSNPFLRSLFTYVAGYDLDDRIAWIIDDLARVFRACDVAAIMEGFGRLTGRQDPFIHFYETFLSAYNPAKRKAKGVWYTPEAAVNFIVRAVDEVLQTEFGLPDGLADTSKVTIDWETGQTDKRGRPIKIKKDVHKVQVLDPATGTGTFLAEVIKQIAPRVKDVAPAMWSKYIESDLIPRLHGFELLMASYAMCHMKLDMILTELGYLPTKQEPRLSVYLTNSLEEGEPANMTLPFTQWLSKEAKGANTIKRDMPIMCVLGNPPYLGESGKAQGWLNDLMDDYKKEPGGRVKLKERNPKWINDLYVRFIRLSAHLIEKNGDGVLGFITNNGYLENPTFRGMRWHLLKTFDKIYILDLHGNSKKKEVALDGTPDKNVFDIQQGVSIIIAVKGQVKTSELAKVFKGDLWGRRAAKYHLLQSASLSDALFEEIETPAPQHAFIKRDYKALTTYEKGFAINEFMPVNSVGVVTARDALTIDMSKEALWKRVQNFKEMPIEEAREKYNLGKDVRDWRVEWAQKDVAENDSQDFIKKIAYRPFDSRWVYYTGQSRGFLCYPRVDVMSNMNAEASIGFVFNRNIEQARPFSDFFVTDQLIQHHTLSIKEVNYLAPLYLQPKEGELDQSIRVNFDSKLYAKLQKIAKDKTKGLPDEKQVFDYIYGALYCPAYREKYSEFLRTDYPRVPWPKTADEFWEVCEKGKKLKELHLMIPSRIGTATYPLMGEGDCEIEEPKYADEKIWINKTHYFDNVPEVAWSMFVGGYQPAQKWLKDRKGNTLSFSDAKHYMQIIKILVQTDRIANSIEMDI